MFLYAPPMSGQLPYSIALEVTTYLPREAEYVPWAAVLDNLGYIRDMLRHTTAYGALRVPTLNPFVCIRHCIPELSFIGVLTLLFHISRKIWTSLISYEITLYIYMDVHRVGHSILTQQEL